MDASEPTGNRIARLVAMLALAGVVVYAASGWLEGRRRDGLVEAVQIDDLSLEGARIDAESLVLISSACDDVWLADQRERYAARLEDAGLDHLRCERP